MVAVTQHPLADGSYLLTRRNKGRERMVFSRGGRGGVTVKYVKLYPPYQFLA